MSRNELVNGARIAAQILNAMSANKKDRIVKRIQAKNPSIMARINANMFTFEEITKLTPQGIQTLIKDIDHNDLVLSLKGASEDVQQALYENMSERKRAMIQDDVSHLPATRKVEVAEAQRRIMDRLDELRREGAIRSQGENDQWV